jgi:hypothetical protein
MIQLQFVVTYAQQVLEQVLGLGLGLGSGLGLGLGSGSGSGLGLELGLEQVLGLGLGWEQVLALAPRRVALFIGVQGVDDLLQLALIWHGLDDRARCPRLCLVFGLRGVSLVNY